jgi:D-alanyl-D-alanine carboxypeptidase
MPSAHIVKTGETFESVAALRLGDPAQAVMLADFNAWPAGWPLAPGTALQIPGARERRAPPRWRTAAVPWPAPPHGMAAITQTFGDIRRFVREDGTADPAWEAQHMGRAQLPFAIPLDWNPTQSARSIRCHKLIAPLLEAVFADIVAQGLQPAVKTYGGGYNWRMKRGQAKPSTHSWGIAIDLNVRSNAMGTAGDMSPALVALFEGRGFVWGGRWSGAFKDPMHFQYCSGY